MRPFFFSLQSLTSPKAPLPMTHMDSKFFLLIFSRLFLRSCISCWMTLLLAYCCSSMVRLSCLTFSWKAFQFSVRSSSRMRVRLYFFSMNRLTYSTFCRVASLMADSPFIIIFQLGLDYSVSNIIMPMQTATIIIYFPQQICINPMIRRGWICCVA